MLRDQCPSFPRISSFAMLSSRPMELPLSRVLDYPLDRRIYSLLLSAHVMPFSRIKQLVSPPQGVPGVEPRGCHLGVHHMVVAVALMCTAVAWAHPLVPCLEALPPTTRQQTRRSSHGWSSVQFWREASGQGVPHSSIHTSATLDSWVVLVQKLSGLALPPPPGVFGRKNQKWSPGAEGSGVFFLKMFDVH